MNVSTLLRLVQRGGLYLILGLMSVCTIAQDVPAVYNNIIYEDSSYYFVNRGEKLPELNRKKIYGLRAMMGSPMGTETGVRFDFSDTTFTGILYFGFIPYGDSKHPMPVYFRQNLPIVGGTVDLNIPLFLRGTYDMVGWEQSGKGTLGYRVVNHVGEFIYDGIISFKGTGPFEIDCTLIEGPFVTNVEPHGAVLSFQTNQAVSAKIYVGPLEITEPRRVTHHEIPLNGLEPDSLYEYRIEYGDNEVSYSFRTAPALGTRKPFTFAYASDSRAGQGGGERAIYGANAYIMKKIMALAHMKKAAFMQFSGDLINGYLTSKEDMHLQYANWKRAIQPFAHYMPVYISMGNHEAVVRMFVDTTTKSVYQIDRFPFETESAETLFAQNFVNPENGPDSEDGAHYDPDSNKVDFPSYKENVFYYLHDNVAMIVLNSDYLYAPTSLAINRTGGGLHGYIMDNQMAWLEKTVADLENNKDIDHIFVTQHTPCFPNGGHVRDDMWYAGNNDFRPWINGRALPHGIIQRRDQLLDIIVNRSTKIRAILTGDEHNYNRLELTPDTQIYPEIYFAPRIKLNRTVYQINNGAAGAPYYAQEQTPWTPYVSNFTTQNALVFVHVLGSKIQVEVLNPDTLEEVDNFWLVE
ncbi:MAG: metallophosphoesterase family protein [Saprospiraceae bacterium]|nr:metallophosphoesterase family protein [Saprospiraceae bacterium]